MPASKWDDEEDSSTPPSSPPVRATQVKRGKFDDEEEDSDVVDSWDKAEDSEEERTKVQAAAAAKAKTEAEARANKKSKSQRIEEKRMEAMKRRQEDEDEEDESEDEADQRARLRREQKESDLMHAQELFGGVGAPNDRVRDKSVTLKDPTDPTKTIELSSLHIFNPTSRDQFTQLRETLVPLISANTKKAPYTSFATEFSKAIAKDLPSDQIKKIASALTTLSNEKMKDEKLAEKGGKKTKAAKSKTTLNASRGIADKADTSAYDDDLGDDDFM